MWTSDSSDSETALACPSGGEHETQTWASQHASSSFTEGESDEELQAFIRMRDQADKATEEWEKLNYDIHSLRCTRREVCTRWKKILLQLGYQKEVDSLLRVNKQTVLGDWENAERARELMEILCEDSGLFPRGVSPNERYFFIMDRLVSLDSADDFVRLAKEKYPKTEP
ncbi:melanoregulin [Chanos chanos]|uniref:Melanoregulin n=1 Tax=Chanos chanos TaxID=29144 RepID=A0A6J2WGP0_CHACN|nr:melanoregulin-like [Chanos chanos]